MHKRNMEDSMDGNKTDPKSATSAREVATAVKGLADFVPTAYELCVLGNGGSSNTSVAPSDS